MNRFDRIIWRINGILILVVGLAAGCVLFFASYGMLKSKPVDKKAGNVVNVNEETQKEEYLFLGSFSKIKGRGIFICPLNADKKHERSYYSKSASSVSNYLFFNPEDTSSHWLLKSNNWRIIDRQPIYENIYTDKSKIVDSFFYEMVRKDTNNDGVLDQDDKKAVYRSDFNGNRLMIVLEETHDILGIKQIDDGNSVIFHLKDEKNEAVVVDNVSGKIVKRSALPIGR